ncbi:MAG: hemerythrin domain-containing protein [Chloroflexi bacterium]|nr:hemerythrin domain-containing protein [Chloroflexota bacterium]
MVTEKARPMDRLAIINRVIEEHRRIRGEMRLLGESVSDMEAIFSLQKMQAGWALSSGEVLLEKQKKLQETVTYLDEGLKKHFAFEERELPPLFGEVLMQALRREHQEILKATREARVTIAADWPADMPPEQQLARRTYTQQAISSMCQMMEEHATREEIILDMMKKTLEPKS